MKRNKENETSQPITCYICVDNYSLKKKPLILVCGHTFCEVCLQSLFDNSNEILCCFCKVITRLEKFDDMIVNYAILSLSENIENENTENILRNNICQFNNTKCTCENLKKNPDRVEKLLQCVECKEIVCPCGFGNTNNSSNISSSINGNGNTQHKNHKLTNLVDYIKDQANGLSDFVKNYRDLANKMATINKKIDKNEFEKIIKVEKEKINSVFKEIKTQLDKNQEIMLHTIDKLLKDSCKGIENFKKEMKYYTTDSTRYCGIIEELCNYNNVSNKQKVKMLNIYNINSTFDEINEFNKDVLIKTERILTPDSFIKRYVDIVKTCELYSHKMIKFANLIYKKQTELLERGFETKIRFYVRNI